MAEIQGHGIVAQQDVDTHSHITRRKIRGGAGVALDHTDVATCGIAARGHVAEAVRGSPRRRVQERRGHGCGLRALTRAAAGAHLGPAVDPVDAIDEHRPAVDAVRLGQPRLVSVDRVVDDPVLAGRVRHHRVVPGADPTVAVLREQHGTAGDGGGHVESFLVQERSPRGTRAPDEHRVPRRGSGAAVGARSGEVVPAVTMRHVGGLVPVPGTDEVRLPHRLQAGVIQLDDMHATEVVAPIEVVPAFGVGEARGVDRVEESSVVTLAGGDEWLLRGRPRSRRRVSRGHADGGVPVVGVQGGVRDGEVHDVLTVDVTHVGRPQTSARRRPARSVALGEDGPEVLPLDPVTGAHDVADPRRVSRTQRVGRRVGVGPAVLGIDDRRVRVGVRERLGHGVGVRPRFGTGGVGVCDGTGDAEHQRCGGGSDSVVDASHGGLLSATVSPSGRTWQLLR